ncbi:MAG: phosphotransferase [Caulobacterales bacterium]
MDLPRDVLAWVAGLAGGEVRGARLDSSSGRHLSYALDVESKNQPLLLRLSEHPASFGDLEREAEILRALKKIGVSVPHVWGISKAHNALLVERLEGVLWVQEPDDPDQRTAVARDYVANLALWHRTPAAELDLPSFQPIKPVKEHQSDHLKGIRATFEEEDRKSPIDAIALATLDYLERKIPDYRGAAVLCQGDNGPANFIYKNQKVVGVIGWEDAHLGDPMDDIAWFSGRAAYHGFPDFTQRLREYEELSGIKIAPDRVCYYRVNACARMGPWFGLADMGQAAERRRKSPSPSADEDLAADGSEMIMSILHRRMRLEALGAALGMTLPSRAVTEAPYEHEHAPLYENMLCQLRTMTPSVSDERASNLVKGLARQIKYLKEVDRFFVQFARQEMIDIARLLGRKFNALDDARVHLAKAAREGKVTFEGYFLYHWNRMVRDDYMMREASGRIYQRSWPALK